MRFLAVVAMLVSIAFGQTSSDVLASVDGATLTWNDLVELVGGEEYTEYLGVTSIDAAADVLQGWVREELIVIAAEESGLESDPYVTYTIEQARRQILLEVYLADLMDDIEVSRLDIENYVNAWADSYTKEVNTRHILVSDLNLANSILARIRSGSDFAELAAQYSICPSSVDGGNLGWMSRGQAVMPFLEAAYQLSPAGMSGVVETNMGYHIIELIAVRNLSPAPSSTEILELAAMELTAARQEKAVLEILDVLQSAHDVNIYPERLLDHL
jgi:parvulin-like peptidyl-prolyl isomerase